MAARAATIGGQPVAELDESGSPKAVISTRSRIVSPSIVTSGKWP